MRFETTCISANGDDINQMRDAATQITRSTFCKRVNKFDRELLENRLGYKTRKSGCTRSWNAARLFMTQDPHVSYYRSTYQGKPCYYFAWSGIEHVFVEEGPGA
jgi:hypothetical protein